MKPLPTAFISFGWDGKNKITKGYRISLNPKGRQSFPCPVSAPVPASRNGFVSRALSFDAPHPQAPIRHPPCHHAHLPSVGNSLCLHLQFDRVRMDAEAESRPQILERRGQRRQRRPFEATDFGWDRYAFNWFRYFHSGIVFLPATRRFRGFCSLLSCSSVAGCFQVRDSSAIQLRNSLLGPRLLSSHITSRGSGVIVGFPPR